MTNMMKVGVRKVCVLCKYFDYPNQFCRYMGMRASSLIRWCNCGGFVAHGTPDPEDIEDGKEG